ncbi:MAG: capsular biosynthesis protein [Paracoccaceae bacterium]
MAKPPRQFLFLQGPHGPFFGQLAQRLQGTGAKVSRIGFNRGDRHFWPRALKYTAYGPQMGGFVAFLQTYIAKHGVSDLVLYGDSRPHHAGARALASALGLRIHCFEEGYLRPYWATYERGGVNGNSALMQLGLPEMRAALREAGAHAPAAPSQWGALWHHTWYGFRYHLNFLLPAGVYGARQTHRSHSVLSELRLHARRIVWLPLAALRRHIQTRAVLRSGAPFHIGLLQLGHDASLRAHSDYDCMRDFVADVIDGFAKGAPAHHRLVFKAHPLEDGREALRSFVRKQASAKGVGGRVDFIMGGKIGAMLDKARTAVTVNSTAAQQALWRGLPVLALGRAVYAKPGLVANQSLADFFANPQKPDRDAYADFRQFLLETSQFSGGFYTAAGRAQLLRVVVDKMLAPNDAYEQILLIAPQPATLRVVPTPPKGQKM